MIEFAMIENITQCLPGEGWPTGDGGLVKSSYRYCSFYTLRKATTFYYAFLLLPRERRRSVYAIYTFSSRLDRVVDEKRVGISPDDVLRELEEMKSLYSQAPPRGDRLTPALQDTIGRYKISRDHFSELVQGMVMDMEQKRYKTFADLRQYCYRVASTVGLICIEIFGHDNLNPDKEIIPPAIDFGIAMQLTNILRDIKEDYRRGRIYLPQEDLARFGVSEESIARGQVDDRFRALMKFQVERAREHFTRAEALIPRLNPGSQKCPRLLKALYNEYLELIEKADYDVLTARPRLSRWKKLKMMVGLWCAPRNGGGS